MAYPINGDKHAWSGLIPEPEQTSGTLDARFLRTRNALVEALFELLDRRSFDQISIREITATAKVGYATFYRHYATKEALLNDLVTFEIGRLIEIATPIVYVGTLRDSVLATCNYVMERQRLWRALLSGGASGILREQFIRQTVRLRRPVEGQAQWLPNELHLACSTGATIDVLSWWLSQKPMPPVQEVADMLERLIEALTSGDDEDQG